MDTMLGCVAFNLSPFIGDQQRLQRDSIKAVDLNFYKFISCKKKLHHNSLASLGQLYKCYNQFPSKACKATDI